ncbi:hypothetical protein L0668_15165 [Paraglaciecola aquimarina]|uniref:Uncharacterized protein n=1 Tax=Paraglaciecola algarum TaxID=3050085 RepID=A0ABS9D910_9ALTE|nr:hypothetical protein [Paraglaciecola sp. G1-23]MCF2949458.1 hypothetical protein [Paraglaciecola sp. G1-23]
MKYLQYRWKSRLLMVLLVSILISLLFITLEQTSWAEQINLQGYTHGENEGSTQGNNSGGKPNFPSYLMYILPFVKELILIGVPLLLTLLVTKLFAKFSQKNKA